MLGYAKASMTLDVYADLFERDVLASLNQLSLTMQRGR
jgi:hypothetical protein